MERDIQCAPSGHFLDLEDSFISRIELSRFEVIFIIIPSTASVAAAEGRKDNLPPRTNEASSVPLWQSLRLPALCM